MAKYKELGKVDLTKTKKGATVGLFGFTGMHLGNYTVVAADKKTITVGTKKGDIVFDRKTGVQTDMEEGRERYANKIHQETPEWENALDKAKEARSAKAKAKADKKAAKAKAKKEPEEDEDDEEEVEEKPTKSKCGKASKGKANGKKQPKKPEPEPEPEDEDEDYEYFDDEEDWDDDDDEDEDEE